MRTTLSTAIIVFSTIAGLSCAPRETTPLTTAQVLARTDHAIGGSTIRSIREAMDVVENNIRNADTTGFKRSTARTGVDGKLQVALDMEQGSLENTGRNLDVGISGAGFFQVKVLGKDGESIAYTRNGNFFVNNRSELVLGLGDGYRLEPPLVIPADSTEVSISQAVLVQVVRAGQIEKTSVGQIPLWVFISPSQLDGGGGTLLKATDASGPAVECRAGENGAGVLLQGFLEKSNVNIDVESRRMRFLQEWLDAVAGR